MRELPPFLEYLNSSGHLVETIVVNDGASQTEELNRFCADRNFVLIHHEINRGKGAAVRSGMLAATKDIRLFTDADIPFQYESAENMLRLFETDNVEMVTGDRRQSDYFANTSWIRQLGTRVFSAMVDMIMLQAMGDTQCGMKGFRARCVDVVFGASTMNGFAADIEWIHRSRKRGLVVRTVPAEFRNSGKSSVVLWKHALPMLFDVLKMRFSKSF